MSELERDFERFFTETKQEVRRYLDDLGQRAELKNVEDGDYRNVTGNLRMSNYHEATEEGLVLGNHASYASEVESRGYNVIDSGVKLIMEELG